MGSILDVVTGWTLFAALVATIGACAARWLLVPRARRRLVDPPEGAHAALDRCAGRLAFAGSLLLLPAMALFFARQLLEFRDPFVPWAEDAELLLTGTAWGATWLRGALGALAAAVVFGLVARGAGVLWWLGTPLVLALGAFPAFTGHASGGDGPRTLLLTADVLHVWAAGAWMGGLAFVLYAERRWLRQGADPTHGSDGVPPESRESLLPVLVPVFSPVAVASVTILVASGTVGAWVHLPSVSALAGSGYGRTLLLKLALVAVVLGLGFLNWRRLTPRLEAAEGPAAMRRSAAAELVVSQLVLVVTALLVRTAPPMG